jgi:integrase
MLPRSEPAMKKNITDKTIKALKPGEEVLDIGVPGFGVRASASGTKRKTFILVARYPGSRNPVRRVLGRYREPFIDDADDADNELVPSFTLEMARARAREWKAMVKAGLDPAQETERKRKKELEAERKKAMAVLGPALDLYLSKKTKLRTHQTLAREMRRELADWLDRPLTDIRKADVKAKIKAIADRGKKAQAYQIFAYINGFFKWIAASDDFDLEHSPCLGIDLKDDVIGDERVVREHVLTYPELASFWKASTMLGHPYGTAFKLLALTALRLREVTDAEWSEIGFDAGVWVIPSQRMKGKEGKARPHAVPLVPDILALLEGLPRLHGDPFLFSTVSKIGERVPVSAFGRMKRKLDALMAADLGKPVEFRLHDIRRTVRTRLSELQIRDDVGEAVLGHVHQVGIVRVYNRNTYLPEKTAALKLWHKKLRSIVESTPKPKPKPKSKPKFDNVVVPMGRRAARA